MRFIFILLFSLIFSALVLGTEHYLDIFDNVDVDAIINNDRILNQYMNCILDKGPCNVDGRTLKFILPETIVTKCEGCSDKQKEMARKIIKYLKKYKPNIWMEFVEKYDPDKEYIASYEQSLAQEEA